MCTQVLSSREPHGKTFILCWQAPASNDKGFLFQLCEGMISVRNFTLKSVRSTACGSLMTMTLIKDALHPSGTKYGILSDCR